MACTVLCYVMLTLKAQTDFWCIIVLSVQNIFLSDMIFFSFADPVGATDDLVDFSSILPYLILFLFIILYFNLSQKGLVMAGLEKYSFPISFVS